MFKIIFPAMTVSLGLESSCATILEIVSSSDLNDTEHFLKLLSRVLFLTANE